MGDLHYCTFNLPQQEYEVKENYFKKCNGIKLILNKKQTYK